MIFTRCFTLIAFFYLCYQIPVQAQSSADEKQRIITLSPHLTEIVYVLEKAQSLVAVSDYSDFPSEAALLPSIASYEGANIAEIMRLQPTHILAWRGGNKDADIAKLKTLGFNVYASQINSVDDLIQEIKNIGEFLEAKPTSERLANEIVGNVTLLRQTYAGQSLNAVYYLNHHPLVGLGNDTWLNSLLNICGINNIYAKSAAAYPQLQISDIIRQQPDVLIAANSLNSKQLDTFWERHKAVLSAKLVSANPDALHRFTPRAIGEITRVCKAVY